MRIPTFFIWFLICFLLQLPGASGQRAIELPRVQVLHKIKLSLPGFTYQLEQPVSRKSVLTLEGGVAGGVSHSSESINGPDFRYAIVPEIGVGFKSYYNLGRRLRKGKRIENNAANFIATDVFFNGNPILSSGNITAREAVGLTAAWGMQRSLSSKFNFEWQAGVIGGTDFAGWVIVPNLRISLSFIAAQGGR